MRCSNCREPNVTLLTCPNCSIVGGRRSTGASARTVNLLQTNNTNNHREGVEETGKSDSEVDEPDEDEIVPPFPAHGGDVGENEVEDDPENPPPPPAGDVWREFDLDFCDEEHGDSIYDDIPAFLVDDTGPRLGDDPPDTPLGFLYLFLTDALIDRFVNNTNSYAIYTDRPDWTELTVQELWVFISIVLYMGVFPLPQRKMYWYGPVFASRFVSVSMTYNRFCSILLCLHWKDSSQYTAQEAKAKSKVDPFWQVSSFINKLAKSSRKLFRCGRHIVIDEQTIRFKGRHPARQYNPKKPNKWHFKVFSLNDSATSYQSNFYIYTGKAEVRPDDVSATNYPAFKLTEKPVYRDRRHILYTDNWFTSRHSIRTMRHRKIYQCGTVKRNKLGTVKQHSLPKKAARGTISSFKLVRKRLYFHSWMDSKPVHFFSSLPSKYTYTKRRLHSGGTVRVRCPTVAKMYSKGMGGTDRFDQQLCYYWPKIRSKKWPVRVIFHFIYVALVNSHILYKMHNQLAKGDADYTLLEYIQSIIDEISIPADLAPIPHANNQRVMRNPDVAHHDPLRLRGVHTPVIVDWYAVDPDTQINTRHDERMTCMLCKKRTKFSCLECNVGLCIGHKGGENHWRIYHSTNF